MIQRTTQSRAGEGIIDDERNARFMRNGCNGVEIGNVATRIPDRFDENETSVIVDRFAKVLGLRLVDETTPDTQLRKRIMKEVVGSARFTRYLGCRRLRASLHGVTALRCLAITSGLT